MSMIAIQLIFALLLNSGGAIANITPRASDVASIEIKPASIRTPKPIVDIKPRTINDKTEKLRAQIDSICHTKSLSSGIVGLFAINMAGDTIISHNQSIKLVPASNVKLLTTGLALKVLGSEYTFRTQIAYSGIIDKGTLKGDLYIIGGGDPTTGSYFSYATPQASLFSDWYKIVKDAGIQRIQGDIIADPRYFSEPVAENLSWCYDDLGTFFGVGPTGLNFFENKQNFLVKPAASIGQKPSITAQNPITPWMNFLCSATTSEPKSANTIVYVPTSLTPVGQFVGEFPVDRKSYTFEGANRFGALTCAYYFYNFLKDKGFSVRSYGDISFDNSIRRASVIAHDKDSYKFFSASSTADTELKISSEIANSSFTVIGHTESPALCTIIAETNHESNNFFAEALLKAFVKERTGSTSPQAIELAIKNEFQSLGLATHKGTYQYLDGSGLSRKDYFSPEFFVNFLQAMTKQDEFEIYLQSIPRPGSRSTIMGKFHDEDPSLKYRIYMKSGSMNGVLCYSGYILSADGDPSKTIVFSLMTNNITAKPRYVYPQVDAIIKSIATFNN